MPFDPTIPQPLTPVDADQIRDQLNALYDEILAIPAGPAGPEGPEGPQGPAGAEGPQGPPGEVTTAALNDAIATTARNPNLVGPLTQSISDPPTQAQVQAIQDAFNALLTAILRPPT